LREPDVGLVRVHAFSLPTFRRVLLRVKGAPVARREAYREPGINKGGGSMNLFGGRGASASPQHLDALRTAVRTRFGLDSETRVMLTELECKEPGCPPVETVIAILAAGANRRWKIYKALREVAPEDIARLTDEPDGR
jgi:hypothetical protein